jgi:hypothetical protein
VVSPVILADNDCDVTDRRDQSYRICVHRTHEGSRVPLAGGVRSPRYVSPRMPIRGNRLTSTELLLASCTRRLSTTAIAALPRRGRVSVIDMESGLGAFIVVPRMEGDLLLNPSSDL